MSCLARQGIKLPLVKEGILAFSREEQVIFAGPESSRKSEDSRFSSLRFLHSNICHECFSSCFSTKLCCCYQNKTFKKNINFTSTIDGSN